MGEIITDKAVMSATGRTWSQWFEELDSCPRMDEGEASVVAWLTDHQAQIGGWWCQVITRRWNAQRTTAAVESS